MNQAQPSPIEGLHMAERQALDALAAISMAIAHGIVLGMNIQRLESLDGKVVSPAVTLFLPGVKSLVEGEQDGPVRQLRLTIPQDGVNFMGLMAMAGDYCHGAMCKVQEAGGHVEDYLHHRQEIETLRRNNRSRIILPRSGKN